MNSRDRVSFASVHKRTEPPLLHAILGLMHNTYIERLNLYSRLPDGLAEVLSSQRPIIAGTATVIELGYVDFVVGSLVCRKLFPPRNIALALLLGGKRYADGHRQPIVECVGMDGMILRHITKVSQCECVPPPAFTRAKHAVGEDSNCSVPILRDSF